MDKRNEDVRNLPNDLAKRLMKKQVELAERFNNHDLILDEALKNLSPRIKKIVDASAVNVLMFEAGFRAHAAQVKRMTDEWGKELHDVMTAIMNRQLSPDESHEDDEYHDGDC